MRKIRLPDSQELKKQCVKQKCKMSYTFEYDWNPYLRKHAYRTINILSGAESVGKAWPALHEKLQFI